MNTQEECQELLMQDVVRIDIMPTTELKVSIPLNVPNITSATVTMSDDSALTDAKLFAASLLSLGTDGGNLADAEIGDGVSHKTTEKREAAGVVRTHTLQVPIEFGFQTIKDKEQSLQEIQFHIVLTTCNGERYLSYSLPESCQFDIDGQMGQTAKMSVRATLQSMSGLIKILTQA